MKKRPGYLSKMMDKSLKEGKKKTKANKSGKKAEKEEKKSYKDKNTLDKKAIQRAFEEMDNPNFKEEEEDILGLEKKEEVKEKPKGAWGKFLAWLND